MIAVGAAGITLTPEWLKEFAIRHFGTNDKLALLVGLSAGIAVLAMMIGIVARRRLVPGLVGLIAFGVLGAVAAVTRPANGWITAVPSIAGCAAGMVALTLLVRAMARAGLATPPAARTKASPRPKRGWRTRLPRPTGSMCPAGSKRPMRSRRPAGLRRPRGRSFGWDRWPRRRRAFRRDREPGRAQGRPVQRRPAEPPPHRRRSAGRRRCGRPRREAPAGPRQRRRRAQERQAPQTRSRAKAVPAGAQIRVPGMTPFVTPNADFYRVDTALACPQVTRTTGQLRITAWSTSRSTITFDDLLDRAADRARHHPDVRLEPGRRRRTPATPAGSAPRCADLLERGRRAARRRPDRQPLDRRVDGRHPDPDDHGRPRRDARRRR